MVFEMCVCEMKMIDVDVCGCLKKFWGFVLMVCDLEKRDLGSGLDRVWGWLAD